MTVPQYSVHPLLLSSRLQFPIQLMLSCNNNIFVTTPTVIILLPSDITHCSNEGYYRSDKYVCIIHLLNVPLTQIYLQIRTMLSHIWTCLYRHFSLFLFVSVVNIICQCYGKNILKTLASCFKTLCVWRLPDYLGLLRWLSVGKRWKVIGTNVCFSSIL